MEFKQLESFAAVVRCQSFTKAAEKLDVSQPTVSTHVRQLETEYGTRLILRTTKRIEATQMGQELYEYAIRILHMRDALNEVMLGGPGKMIRLGVSTVPSAYILPDVMPGFRREHPEIGFSIHQADSQGVMDALLSGMIELGMTGMTGDSEKLTFIPFYNDVLVLITPKTEPFLSYQKNGLPASVLTEEPFIMREQGSGSRKCMERYFEKTGLREEDLNVVARLNDQGAIKSLVQDGLGISVISEMAARRGGEGRYLTFPLPGYQPARSLYLVFRRDETLKPQTRALIEYILAYYGGSAADLPPLA